jgi:DNA-binding NtrC family response regulator
VNSRLRILLVDDEPLLTRVWGRLLASDAQVATATSLEEAWNLLALATFDVVLVDLMLRELSGAVLLEWLQRHQPRVRRVLASGVSSEEGEAYVQSGLAHDFLAKPASRDRLIAAVQARVESR